MSPTGKFKGIAAMHVRRSNLRICVSCEDLEEDRSGRPHSDGAGYGHSEEETTQSCRVGGVGWDSDRDDAVQSWMRRKTPGVDYGRRELEDQGRYHQYNP